MADFNNAVITNAGFNLMTNCMEKKKKFAFTTAAIGDGEYTAADNLFTAKTLKDEKMSNNISYVGKETETCIQLYLNFNNKELTEGFYIREIGVFAKEYENSNSTPILFAIVTAKIPDYMPADNDLPFNLSQHVYIELSNADSVTFNIKKDEVYMLLTEGYLKYESDTRYSMFSSKTFDSEGKILTTTLSSIISAGSFASGNTDITDIFISEKVKSITNGSFAGCSNLSRVIIQNNSSNITIQSEAIPSDVKIIYDPLPTEQGG